MKKFYAILILFALVYSESDPFVTADDFEDSTTDNTKDGTIVDSVNASERYTDQAHLWRNLDIIIGFMLGSYSKVSYFSRNMDCFSHTLGLGQTFAAYNMAFDQKFPKEGRDKIIWFSVLGASIY